MSKNTMRRQTIRKLILLASFATFPITIIYLAPAPPIMSIKAGVINLSVITISAIFVSGLIFRRAFCGWLCPGGGCQLVGQALNDKQITEYKTNWPRIVLVGIWVIVMIASVVFSKTQPQLEPMHPGAGRFATSNVRYFLPYIPVVISIYIFVLIFGRRGFCSRGCWIYPLIAASSKIGQIVHLPSLYVKLKQPENCKDCRLCTKLCPMSITVDELVKQKRLLPNNCIQCGLCIDKCPKEVYAFSFGIER